jgi:hypothetical protein
MMQRYSDPRRARDPYSLPDIETFQLTAAEVAERDEEMLRKYSKRHEFRLATLDRRIRERMLEAMIREHGIKGGWFFWYCLPGCMPSSESFGPYESEREALEEARKQAGVEA